MKNNQITIEQHFVPQCYLKEFTNNDGKVFAYDKKGNLLSKKYSPKSILFEKLLYELNLDDPDNKIENFFAKIEDKYSKLTKKLLSLKSPDDFNLTLDEKTILFLFVLRLSFGNINQYKKLNHDGFNNLWKGEILNHNLSPEEQKISLKKLDEHNRRQLPIAIQVVFDPFFITEFMLRKKFIFILCNDENIFLTSDNPVVERCGKETGLFGSILTDTNYCLALSPYIFLRIVDNETDSSIPDLGICHDKSLEVSKKHNKLMFEQCEKFVYGDTPKLVL